MTDQQFAALMNELQTIRHLLLALLDKGEQAPEPEQKNRYL